MVKPNFLIIGPAKTATTWLMRALGDHPEVYMHQKEVRYFSFNSDKNEQWYKQHFPDENTFKAVGEKSPSYLMYAAPEDIYTYNKDVKLITILRNPVERAYSHYCMFLKANKVGEDPDKEIKKGSRFVDEGFYYKYLSSYLKIFDEKQLQILFYADLKNDPEAFLESVFSFLNVDNEFRPEILDKKYHARSSRPKWQSFYNGLASLIHKVNELSIGRLITGKLRQSYAKRLFWKIMGSEKEFPEMSKEKIKELKKIYSEDVQHLEKLTNRNLNHWK